MKETAVRFAAIRPRRPRRRAAHFSQTWETLEVRQLMSGTIDFLDTSGPAAHTGDDPRAVVTTDVNGDGKVDLVTGNAQGFSVLVGDGSGGFSLTTDVNLGKQVLSIHAADLNGDGKTDLLFDKIFGGVAVVPGNGDGTFGAATDLEYDDTPGNFSLADVNGDDKTDIVSGIAVGPTGVLVRYNESSTGGPISFAAEQVVSSDAIRSDAIAADVNGDGRADLVGIYDSVAVMLNTGNDPQTGRATFAPALTYATTFVNPNSIAAADITGDGMPEVFVQYTNMDFDVLVNNGDGTFAAPTAEDGVSFNDGYADVNGDGKVDVYGSAVSFGKKFAVNPGNGDGTFGEPQTLALANVSFSGSAVADVNSDGKPDVLIVDNDEDRVVILTGGAEAQTPTPTPTTPPTPTPTPPPTTNESELSVAAPAGLASTLTAGQKVKSSVNVMNSGDAATSGPVTVKVYASPDGVIDDGDTLLTQVSKSLKLAGHKGKALPLKFTVPTVGDGTFQIITQVTSPAGQATTTTSGTPVNFVVPKLDVAAGIGSIPALKAGKKANVTLNLTNAGGAPITGPAVVKLYSTTGGTFDGQEVQLGSVNAKLNIKSGKVKKQKVSFVVPAELAGQTRTLVAKVELAGDVQSSNDAAAGPSVNVA
jgi:hypothetical protein